jgi:hypothetical protein
MPMYWLMMYPQYMFPYCKIRREASDIKVSKRKATLESEKLTLSKYAMEVMSIVWSMALRINSIYPIEND